MAQAAEKRTVSDTAASLTSCTYRVLLQALREQLYPRPAPKRVLHLEDVLYQNGLRFVRPNTRTVLGAFNLGSTNNSASASNAVEAKN